MIVIDMARALSEQQVDQKVVVQKQAVSNKEPWNIH